uniref:Uncharacterized protein n=1 Tax=Panagrolaimus davidi TaxID=227884 RepID=A0A914QFD4_9BILA
MDLAEKAYIAGSTRFKAEMKDKCLREGGTDLDDEVITAPKPLVHAAWKVAVGKCIHRRKAFMENVGKNLVDKNVRDLEEIKSIMAFVSNAKFMASGKTDTVVVGGENAAILARAFGSQHWPMMCPDDYIQKAKVIFGAAIKRVIYCPTGELFFRYDSKFAEATKLVLEALETLARYNDVHILVLPILRHCAFPDVNQELTAWYKELNVRHESVSIMGNQEVDEMKLINWLRATPLSTSNTQFVDAQGILSKEGVQVLGEYLKNLGHTFKVNVNCLMERNREKPPSDAAKNQVVNAKDRHRGWNEKPPFNYKSRGHSNLGNANRGHQNRGHQNRGHSSRGHQNRGQSNRGRGSYDDNFNYRGR